MASDAGSLLDGDATSSELGGRVCLAVVNSVWWRRSDAPQDQFQAYPDVVEHVERGGWLTDVGALLGAAQRRPDDAARVLRQAVALRERMYAAFSACAAGERPGDADLRAIERVGRRGLAALQLRPGPDGGYRLRWSDDELEVPLWQAGASAMLLLASIELAQVKQCPGEKCGWVFLDTTRNHSRRWCNSAECGNRSRVHAHYQRARIG